MGQGKRHVTRDRLDNSAKKDDVAVSALSVLLLF